MDYIRDSIRKISIKKLILPSFSLALAFILVIIFVLFSEFYKMDSGSGHFIIIFVIIIIIYLAFSIMKNILAIHNLKYSNIRKCLQAYSNDIDCIAREINRSIEKNLLFKYNTDKSSKIDVFVTSSKIYIFVTDEWFVFFSENNSIIKKTDELVWIDIKDISEYVDPGYRFYYYFSFYFRDKTIFKHKVRSVYGEEILELFKQHLPNSYYKEYESTRISDEEYLIVIPNHLKFEIAKSDYEVVVLCERKTSFFSEFYERYQIYADGSLSYGKFKYFYEENNDMQSANEIISTIDKIIINNVKKIDDDELETIKNLCFKINSKDYKEEPDPLDDSMNDMAAYYITIFNGWEMVKIDSHIENYRGKNYGKSAQKLLNFLQKIEEKYVIYADHVQLG